MATWTVRQRSATLPAAIVADSGTQPGSSCGRLRSLPAPVSYRALRSLLFRLEPETAHRAAFVALGAVARSSVARRLLSRRQGASDPRLRQRIWGLDFPNPVGLAAGLDKDASVLRAWAALGFGFVEVGTVTPRPQAGNPRPRLFRYPDARSLQNRMGFNNLGVEAMACRLARSRGLADLTIPIGVNVGKNRDTPLDRAADDYEVLLRRLAGLSDYFVINVSSPNTPGLRSLQEPARLERLMNRLEQAVDAPLLLKISPDLAEHEIDEICRVVLETGISGVIATNTTAETSLLRGAYPEGGLSGRVLASRSEAVLRRVARRLHGRCPIISVGGVERGEDAYRRLRAGASLVQIYTALVYEGPSLPRRMVAELSARLDADRVESLDEIIGLDVRGGNAR